MISRWWLPFVSVSVLTAQQAAPWSGEWGSYKEQALAGAMHAEGQRLSIAACLRLICQAAVESSQLTKGRCAGTGTLTLQAADAATVTLPSPKGGCTLKLRLTGVGNGRAIHATQASGACSSFCTGSCSFTRVYAFRSPTPFYGDDVPGCFLQRSKSLAAVCSDKSLADLERSWREIGHHAKGELPNCNQANDVAACLRASFAGEIRKGAGPQ